MVKQPGLDYEELVEFLNKKKEAQSNDDKLAADTVRNRMHKVAFDVYSIDNDPYDALWRLESNADDGKEYLVRMDNDSTVEAKTGGWVATSNESGSSITLAYRGVPVQRLSGKIFGFSKEDVGLFKKALLEKVSKNDSFRGKILDMQSDERKTELFQAFPELAVRK